MSRPNEHKETERNYSAPGPAKAAPALVINTRLWRPIKVPGFLYDPRWQSCVPSGPRPLVFSVTARRGRAFGAPRFSASLPTMRDAGRCIGVVGVQKTGRENEKKFFQQVTEETRPPPWYKTILYTHTHQIFNYFSGIMGRARGSRVV